MQLLAYVKHLNTALKILSNECNSWCTKVIDSVDSENLVQEYFMQTKVEQFILHSHPVPDSIQISQNGKKDNIHSSKVRTLRCNLNFGCDNLWFVYMFSKYY